MALVMFFLVERNSSSFSAILLSISCLTWVSSSWHLSTLFSSCSRAPSASDRAASSSIFSASILLQILSISWMERPPSLIWSMMSLISLLRVLFSLLTSSSWRTDSSYADLTRNSSEEALRVSFWAPSRSMPMLSTFCFHSPTILSNCLAFFSMELLRIWAWSSWAAMFSSSPCSLDLLFSTWDSLAFSCSAVDSASDRRACIFSLAISSSAALATPSFSYLSFIISASPLAFPSCLITFSLQLSQQVTVLSGQLPLVVLNVSQGQVGLLDLLAQVIESSLQVLQVLLSGGLAAVDLISGSAGISDLVHDLSLVLLNLRLDLVELFNLLLHFSIGILVLLLQTDNSSLLLDLGLLQVPPQLGHLGLSLLVKLNLCTGSTASLVQPLAQVLQLSGQVGPLSLGLGSALSLSLQLLLHLLDPGLDLLDGLLDLGHQGLLVLQLAHQGAAVLLLALDGALQLLPGPLQLGDGLLHHLQLSLNLPPLLLNVGTATLLLLVRALKLVESGLKLVLDLVQVADLVLSDLQVLGGLGGVLADVLLLLVQLVDHLVLVGDLIIETLDGVIPVG